jgi:hypothetical protein
MNGFRPVGDIATVTVLGAAWLDMLSTGLTIVATAAALVYTLIRISETQSFRRFVAWIRSKL